MLLRKFIGQRLASYYAQSADKVVSGSSSPKIEPLFNFRMLLGEWHWKRQLDQLYRRQQGQWFTPVELFQPFYSNTMANFIADRVNKNGSSNLKTTTTTATTTTCTDADDDNGRDDGDSDIIDVVELGGGRATNAIAILDYLQQTHPEIYKRVHYHIVDGSQSLHRFQRQRFQGTMHFANHKVSFVHKDLAHVAEGRTQLLPTSANRITFVIAFEVLDNLPHDKIKVRGAKGMTSGGGGGPVLLNRILQCHVQNTCSQNQNGQECWEEEFTKLSDPLLEEMLQVAIPPENSPRALSYFPEPGDAAWIPTVAMGVLHHLPQYRPKAQVLLADFDWFPPFGQVMATVTRTVLKVPPRKSLLADHEPLIKSMHEHDNCLEYECYLTAPLLCDILFPTNFIKLANFVKQSWNNSNNNSNTNNFGATTATAQRDVTVHKQADFLFQYGPEQVKQTSSWLTGFSPMLEDYSNTSVLTVTFPTASAAEAGDHNKGNNSNSTRIGNGGDDDGILGGGTRSGPPQHVSKSRRRSYHP